MPGGDEEEDDEPPKVVVTEVKEDDAFYSKKWVGCVLGAALQPHSELQQGRMIGLFGYFFFFQGKSFFL